MVPMKKRNEDGNRDAVSFDQLDVLSTFHFIKLSFHLLTIRILLSYMFLPSGDVLGPKYVKQLLFRKKNVKLLITQWPLMLEINKLRFGILIILQKF